MYGKVYTTTEVHTHVMYVMYVDILIQHNG